MSISKILYQILCVFSQMKDTKHVRWDYYSFAWVMPEGWDLGARGVPRRSNIFFFSNMVMKHIKSTGMTSRTWGGQISLTCQFQRFLYQTLCVFSQIKDRKHIEQNFHSVAKVKPRCGTAGCWGSKKTFSVEICDSTPLTARSSF